MIPKAADEEGPLSGKLVLDQVLIQKVLKTYLEEECSENPLAFWQFAENYLEWCLKASALSSLTNCSYEMISEIGQKLDTPDLVKEIQSRVEESFEEPLEKGTSENDLLEEEKTDYYLNGVFMIPSVMINGIFYKGNLVPDLMFSTICDTIGSPSETVQLECFNQYTVQIEPDNLIHFILYGLIFVGLMAVLVVSGCIVYRLVIKNDMDRALKQEIDSAVGNYLKMQEFSIN